MFLLTIYSSNSLLSFGYSCEVFFSFQWFRFDLTGKLSYKALFTKKKSWFMIPYYIRNRTWHIKIFKKMDLTTSVPQHNLFLSCNGILNVNDSYVHWLDNRVWNYYQNVANWKNTLNYLLHFRTISSSND